MSSLLALPVGGGVWGLALQESEAAGWPGSEHTTIVGLTGCAAVACVAYPRSRPGHAAVLGEAGSACGAAQLAMQMTSPPDFIVCKPTGCLIPTCQAPAHVNIDLTFSISVAGSSTGGPGCCLNPVSRCHTVHPHAMLDAAVQARPPSYRTCSLPTPKIPACR